MKRTLRLFLCQCLLWGLAMPLTADAQDTRGKISGTVRDSAGVVPGAAITITNTDTDVSQSLTTNGSGYFEAPLLNPGIYTVSVQVPGYKAIRRDGLTLGVGEQVTVPLVLEVGQVTEEVVVTAETPLLDTASVKSAT
ncbi:MAG: carboxypeptidase-like regulatory domain-containing protein, partial [Vicinamibacterales bacterium]